MWLLVHTLQRPEVIFHPCSESPGPPSNLELPLPERGPKEQEETLLKDNGKEKVRGQVEEELGLPSCPWFL